jgi:hypothetical protein
MKKEPTRSSISSKSRNINYYLDLMWDEFLKLEVYSTAGDIRPPYPFQWIATSKVLEGDDDCYEGTGGSPLEAIRELYKQLKKLKLT